MLDWVGWAATAITASSYFCKRSVVLRHVQALAAVVWIGYGVLAGVYPVVIANLIVAVAATFSAWREREAQGLKTR